MTMFYFRFISHVRAALFFNVLKTRNNSEMLKQFVSRFYFSFISHLRASEIKLFYISFISCCANRFSLLFACRCDLECALQFSIVIYIFEFVSLYYVMIWILNDCEKAVIIHCILLQLYVILLSVSVANHKLSKIYIGRVYIDSISVSIRRFSFVRWRHKH